MLGRGEFGVHFPFFSLSFSTLFRGFLSSGEASVFTRLPPTTGPGLDRRSRGGCPAPSTAFIPSRHYIRNESNQLPFPSTTEFLTGPSTMPHRSPFRVDGIHDCHLPPSRLNHFYQLVPLSPTILWPLPDLGCLMV